MQRREILAMGAAIPIAAACSSAAAPAPAASHEIKTGGSRMIPIAGGYKVYTKRIGNSRVKVLTLHGGPGSCHDYLECFEDFLPRADIEFYYYDQLGCGYSNKPTDDSLWTIERYVEEVEQVRLGLGLEHFVLYGQSWGGMLGYEYALKYGRHLQGLVISNMTASIAAYEAHAKTLEAELSPADQAAIGRYEAAGQFDAPEYNRILTEKLYAKHVCRLAKLPEPLTRTFRKANEHIYNVMQGPNEFVVTGNFKHWDRWADLPKISTPTLVMGARYDEMDPEQMRRVAALIPGAQLFISERGSHLTLYDDQEPYFAALTRFLRSFA
jgi:proline iminopeptidase